jgi:hypothetical protein
MVQLDAEIGIDRSDFGLTWNQMGTASMKTPSPYGLSSPGTDQAERQTALTSLAHRWLG